jgi:hypothetical protein
MWAVPFSKTRSEFIKRASQRVGREILDCISGRVSVVARAQVLAALDLESPCHDLTPQSRRWRRERFLVFANGVFQVVHTKSAARNWFAAADVGAGLFEDWTTYRWPSFSLGAVYVATAGIFSAGGIAGRGSGW